MHTSNRSNRPLSEAELIRRDTQSENDKRRQELLTRDDIQTDYRFSKRWLELAALSGNGPPMIKISSRMVRYQRGVFEDWLAARTVSSTSTPLEAA